MVNSVDIVQSRKLSSSSSPNTLSNDPRPQTGPYNNAPTTLGAQQQGPTDRSASASFCDGVYSVYSVYVLGRSSSACVLCLCVLPSELFDWPVQIQ